MSTETEPEASTDAALVEQATTAWWETWNPLSDGDDDPGPEVFRAAMTAAVGAVIPVVERAVARRTRRGALEEAADGLEHELHLGPTAEEAARGTVLWLRRLAASGTTDPEAAS